MKIFNRFAALVFFLVDRTEGKLIIAVNCFVRAEMSYSDDEMNFRAGRVMS